MLKVKVKEARKMMNFLKKVKNLFSANPAKEVKSPVTPGTDKSPKEDVGKKVFEKTGKLREGIAQSSTVVETEFSQKPKARDEFKPQPNPAKHHGIRKRKNVVETTGFKNNSSKNNSSNKENSTPGNKNSSGRRKPRFKQKTKE